MPASRRMATIVPFRDVPSLPPTPLFVSVNTVPSNTPATGLKRFPAFKSVKTKTPKDFCQDR